jgi:hypothetical protein
MMQIPNPEGNCCFSVSRVGSGGVPGQLVVGGMMSCALALQHADTASEAMMLNVLFPGID